MRASTLSWGGSSPRTKSDSRQLHALSDDLLHDLRGPTTDRHQPDVAGEARQVVFLHVADTTVGLEAIVGDTLGEVGGEELRHRDLPAALLAGVKQRDRMVVEALGGLKLSRQLRELVLPNLEIDDALAEGLAFLAVADGVGKCELRTRDAGERGDQTLALEILHDVEKALVFFADQVAPRDAAIFEEQQRRVGGVVPHLFELLAD